MRTKEKLRDRILDEMIKQALLNNADKIDEQYPSNQELSKHYTFSESFGKRMQKLFKQIKRKEQFKRLQKTLAKIAVVALLFITISFVTIMNVDAFRVSFLNFISELKDSHTKINIRNNGSDNYYKGIAIPTYLPEGFENVFLKIHDNSYISFYRDKNHNEIHLQQLMDGAYVGIDSEGAHYKSLIINGEKADYYEKQNEATLVYKFDGKVFLLSSTNLPKEELIKIAESMEQQ